MELSELNINKRKITQFNKRGIETIEQLIKEFLPRNYIDFRYPKLIQELQPEQYSSLILTLVNIRVDYSKQYVKASATDELGAEIDIVWFNSTFIYKTLKRGVKYIVCGKSTINKLNNKLQLINPMSIDEDIEKYKKIMPIYSQIQGMSLEYLNKCIDDSLTLLGDCEYLDSNAIKKFNLLQENKALLSLHKPNSSEEIIQAKRRMIFDTLFKYQFQLEKRNRKNKKTTEIKIERTEEFNNLIKKLPFNLTKDQDIAITNMIKDMKEGKRINSLLTADVGAGKTIIAFLLMIAIAENGYQAALMAPTTVLAKQHYNELKDLLEDTPFKVCFLNGFLKVREKKEILKGIKTGEYNFIVGTHSIIQKDVEFNNLGIGIIDEEHRFGVAQRNAIIDKTEDIHYLSISATPIPRSLALTIYGDETNIININSMPNGRKPIITGILQDKIRAYKFMLEEINKGHQCYFVCPLIEKSNCEAMELVDSVEEIYAEMERYFTGSNINISVVTGKMKEEEVEEEIRKFKENKSQIMIATTVIEVGVNIPNATVMVINNAERFGLAQLHQLRGRVGRSDLQSYCILISQNSSDRLDVMTRTNNGFAIANEDLKIRGTGNLIGVEQSGQNEFMVLMLQYPNLFAKIKAEIKEIYDMPQRLSNYELKENELSR